MRKILFFILIFVNIYSYSQISFSHSFGSSFIACKKEIGFGFMYSPRLNILSISEKSSLSVGTHTTVGLSGNSKYSTSSFLVDIPIVAEFNFGFACNPDYRSPIGGFIGLGYGICKIKSFGYMGVYKNYANGIVINAGIRSFYEYVPLGMRISYLFNSEEKNYDVFSIGVFYIMGYD